MADCLKARDGENVLTKIFAGKGGGKKKQSTGQATKALASQMDVDAFGKSFTRFAGSDDIMDSNECAHTANGPNR